MYILFVCFRLFSQRSIYTYRGREGTRESSMVGWRTPSLTTCLDLPSVLSNQVPMDRGQAIPQWHYPHDPVHPRSWIYKLVLPRPAICLPQVRLEPATSGLGISTSLATICAWPRWRTKNVHVKIKSWVCHVARVFYNIITRRSCTSEN